MGAGHDHGPSLDQAAGHPGDYRKKLGIAFGITATIVAAQAEGKSAEDVLAFRGGSWINYERFTRAASRFRIGQDGRFRSLGFRLVSGV